MASLKYCLLAASVALMTGAVLNTTATAASIDPIKTRQDIFKEFKEHFGEIKTIAKAGDLSKQSDLLAHTKALAAAADKQWSNIDKHFPKGSDQGDTEAMPAVWENFDDFKAKAGDEKEAIAKMIEAAQQKNADAWIEGFKGLGSSCKGCHEHYKKD